MGRAGGLPSCTKWHRMWVVLLTTQDRAAPTKRGTEGPPTVTFTRRPSESVEARREWIAMHVGIGIAEAMQPRRCPRRVARPGRHPRRTVFHRVRPRSDRYVPDAGLTGSSAAVADVMPVATRMVVNPHANAMLCRKAGRDPPLADMVTSMRSPRALVGAHIGFLGCIRPADSAPIYRFDRSPGGLGPSVLADWAVRHGPEGMRSTTADVRALLQVGMRGSTRVMRSEPRRL